MQILYSLAQRHH